MTEPKERPLSMQQLRELLVAREYPPRSHVNAPLFRHYRDEILILLAHGYSLNGVWQVLHADRRMRCSYATFRRIARAQQLPTPHPLVPTIQ